MRVSTLTALFLACAATGGAGERLSAPVLVSPADQARLVYPHPVRAITPLIWKEVAGAVRYRLVLDFSPAFKKPLHDGTVTAATTQALTGLDVGLYYWRVAAIDADGAEGAFSEPARFRVETGSDQEPTLAPTLVLSTFELRSAGVLSIKGRTDPGATVTVDGHPVLVAADGSFNEFVTIRGVGPRDVVILATAPDGGVTKKTERIVTTR